MKNRITDLRNHLFAALEGLADPDNPLDIERAKAIAEVSKVVIESAKVEVDFCRVTGQTTGSGFMEEPNVSLLPNDDRGKIPKPRAMLSSKPSGI